MCFEHLWNIIISEVTSYILALGNDFLSLWTFFFLLFSMYLSSFPSLFSALYFWASWIFRDKAAYIYKQHDSGKVQYNAFASMT